MGLDKNKHISSITYNYLNKPEKITVTGQGVITYVYDAAGNRLQKRIEDQVNNTEKVYDYIGNFVYEDSMLQYILNEEGRCRPVADSTTNDLTKFVYDYFIKDHLGNLRSTVTAQPMSPAYLAMHEIASANIEQLVFDNIPNVRNGKPGSMDPNDGMAALLVASDPETRVGTSILLRTMPGDPFNINVKSFYEGDPQPEGTIELGDVMGSLISTLSGGVNYENSPIVDIPDNVELVNSLFSDPSIYELFETIPVKNQSEDAPRAFLNILFFDEGMTLVPELSQRIQVRSNGPGNPQWYTSENDFHEAAYSGPRRPGYLAVFIDNQEIGKDVWFDDLFIGHYTSEVLEENHYYPFGLTLSSTAAGAEQPYKYNGKELEKSIDLEQYDYEARRYNPQEGRFLQIDNSAEDYFDQSPYNYVGNNPISRIDPDGNNWWDVVVGTAVAALDNNLGTNLRNSYTPKDASDYKGALMAQDVKDFIGGVVEGGAGAALLSGSITATTASGGLAIEVSAPAAVTGAAMAAHGTFKAIRAMDNLKNSSQSTSSSHKSSSSSYERTTSNPNRPEEKRSVENRKTDVSKENFEKNIEKSGFQKKQSDNGVNVYKKDNSSYTTRGADKSRDGQSTADFRKDNTQKKPDLKIRLKD